MSCQGQFPKTSYKQCCNLKKIVLYLQLARYLSSYKIVSKKFCKSVYSSFEDQGDAF